MKIIEEIAIPKENVNDTDVILCVNNYDYGMPGHGVLIWRINELNSIVVGTLLIVSILIYRILARRDVS